VTTLPVGKEGGSAATLGGWNVAVSKFSTKQEAAISLALYLAGPEAQKHARHADIEPADHRGALRRRRHRRRAADHPALEGRVR
jgi:maltose-binding protein MalE